MCNCIVTTNEMLAEHNAALVATMFGSPRRCVIDTYKVDSKKRGKPPLMLASFCPFCGEAHDASEGAA